MKLKPFALKGLAILTVVLALCAFFSGTIRTITTPKVKLISPSMGKIEEKITITGKVYFPEIEEIRPEIPEDVTLTIRRIGTRAGYTVKKGDVLIEAEVTGYGEKLAMLTKEYQSAESELATLERKNADVRVRQADINYVEAYKAYQAARSDCVLKRITLDTLLSREGIELNEDGSLPEGASEETRAAAQEYADAQQTLATAEKTWERMKRYSIDENVYSYLTEKSALEDRMAAAEEEIRTLSALNAAVSQITAPDDGYAASVEVAEGDVWDGKKAILTISAKKSEPVLRADITDLERTIAKKTQVQIEARYGSVESRVTEVVVDTDGRKYAYVDINSDVLDWVGSVYSMMQLESGKEMTIVYKAKESSCLVPVSAVHGSGEDRYVYVVDRTENAFGTTEMTVRKVNVQVEKEVDGVAALQEDISWYTIAYMEDRAISAGDRVMAYTD